MRFRKYLTSLVTALSLIAPVHAAEQFVPVVAYWTGPYAAGGSAFGDGMADYYDFLNYRDGGINGVRLTFEKCETTYKPERFVDCYEKLKAKGATGAPFFHPLSTDSTYRILERAKEDKIPVITIGYGRTDASDGRVFPYVFPALTNYWSPVPISSVSASIRTGTWAPFGSGASHMRSGPSMPVNVSLLASPGL